MWVMFGVDCSWDRVLKEKQRVHGGLGVRTGSKYSSTLQLSFFEVVTFLPNGKKIGQTDITRNVTRTNGKKIT